MNNPVLLIKDQVGPPLQVSKWLKCPLLLEVQEMEHLLTALGDFTIFAVSRVVPQGEAYLTKEEFLGYYKTYVETLKNGEVPSEPTFRPIFSTVWTASLDCLYAVNLSEDKQLVKADKPVIQLQPHRFDYSTVDGKFRSMVFGTDSITWGIQFSYPQLFQDANMQVKQVKEGVDFPNTALFKQLQRWMRQYTIATPFVINGVRTNVPIRLGKTCLPWINQHPQLVEKGLSVQI